MDPESVELDLSLDPERRGLVISRDGTRRIDGGAEEPVRVHALAGDAPAAALDATTADRVLAFAHPHAVRVLEVGASDRGAPFTVVERTPGEPLGRVIRRGPVELERAIRIGFAVARALEAAHAASPPLVHGAVRPDAIRVRDDDGSSAQLDDWGFGHAMGPAARASATLLNDTARFHSPEHAREAALQPGSDVFALASTLFEAVLGEPAFAGRTPITLLMHIAQGRPPQAPGIESLPSALRVLLERCWSAEPNARPSATELVRELAALLPEEPVAAHAPPPRPFVEAPISDAFLDPDPTTQRAMALPNHVEDEDGPTMAFARVGDEVTMRGTCWEELFALLRDDVVPGTIDPPARTMRLSAPVVHVPRSPAPDTAPLRAQREPTGAPRFGDATHWALVGCTMLGVLLGSTALAMWLGT
ncbi:MAG: protein kinase [Sandaracinaceae bacterium]